MIGGCFTFSRSTCRIGQWRNEGGGDEEGGINEGGGSDERGSGMKWGPMRGIKMC